ncbi:NUDIX domain-containing protein [Microbacterium sp. NPDC057407]|uniref:NUDIX domain-containing protein n=1 Tax=Microbacterium sp. NPDC057407 TaxID=3346120 RepID=UPI00366F9811
MPVHSAGLLLYRVTDAAPEVFIAHMGGPYWSSKDEGAWSVPKGEYDPDSETALDAALREFEEELGVAPPPEPYAELGTWSYASGKRITVFVADGAGFAPDEFVFGEFELEWPPRSGRTASFPEVDRAEWMPVADARAKLVKGQRPALDALEQRLSAAGA